MSSEIRLPDKDHPITIERDTDRVVARVGNMVIADTTAALTLREAGYPPVHYFPLQAIVPGTLRASSTQTYCPYKGDASYYDVVLADGQELVDAVWRYQSPHPAMAAIADHVAFYTDRVKVTAETNPTAVEARGMPTVAQLMRAAVVSVERDAHLAAVAYLMRRAGDTALVVVNDLEQRAPLTVITDTDIAQAIADGNDPNDVRVSDLVRRDLITVSPRTSVTRAARLMVSAGIRHLPVVADGRLLGMVDISDTCRALVGMQNSPMTESATVAV